MYTSRRFSVFRYAYLITSILCWANIECDTFGFSNQDNHTIKNIHPITRFATTPILFAITGDDSNKADSNANDPIQPTTSKPNQYLQPTSPATVTSLIPILTTMQIPNKDNNLINKLTMTTTLNPQTNTDTAMTTTISTSSSTAPYQEVQTTTAMSPAETSTMSQTTTLSDQDNLNNMNNNLTKPDLSQPKVQSILDMSMIIYSAFIVYIAFIKVIYHNFQLINCHFTEPGILMIFGIIWQLILRQIVEDPKLLPRFNSRIFFYLFLPSTVLDSASMLANKWLFFNLFSILILSIIGTLIYSASIGFTILALSNNSIFNVDFIEYTSQVLITNQTATTTELSEMIPPMITLSPMANLTLIDCFILGTILSSFDSNTMLNSLRLHQANEKLYYLVLGENLMNNAVVLVIFNLLLEFLNEPRLTLFRIYGAILKFFLTLLGAVVIGFCLAFIALVSIRCIKRFRSHRTLTNYQNQCLAMVETLLILKLGYFSYTLAALAGTSSILCLATFGVLQNEYIKRNLTLRSQFTLRQVTYATKTLGYSLVYPLIGMLIVQVIQDLDPNQHHLYYNLPSILQQPSQQSLDFSNQNLQTTMATTISASIATTTSSVAGAATGATTSAGTTTKRDNTNALHRSINMFWIFKLLSFICLILLAYRFLIVIILSQINNILSSRQLRIHFVEQILLAYGSLKGPLALALVYRLIEHEQYRDRPLNEKHLFIYTILFITFISNVFKGPLIRPLVARVQMSLCHSLAGLESSRKCIVFNEVSCVVIDYATHGLNSILGRKKSFYDRFLELNEHLLKPLVAGTGSRTNWLMVFYDNLILEETMNANCFHTSIRESARQLANKKTNVNQERSFEQSITARSVVTSSLGFMEKLKRRFKNINAIEPQATSTNSPQAISTDIARSTPKRKVSATTKHHQKKQTQKQSNQEHSNNYHDQGQSQHGAIPAARLQHPSNREATESALLREVVMYNLRRKDSMRRRRREREQQLRLDSESPVASVKPHHQSTSVNQDKSPYKIFKTPSSSKDDSSIDIESQNQAILRRNYERDMCFDALERAMDRESVERVAINRNQHNLHPQQQQQQQQQQPTLMLQSLINTAQASSSNLGKQHSRYRDYGSKMR